MSFARLFSAAAVFLVASCGAQSPNQAKADTFAGFWSQFRRAVAEKDNNKLASLAAFPFQTRGVNDSDPVENHDKAWFTRNIDRLLDQDSGLSAEPENMRAYIGKKTVVLAQPPEGPVRVANFVFKKIGGKWLFAFSYVED